MLQKTCRAFAGVPRCVADAMNPTRHTENGHAHMRSMRTASSRLAAPRRARALTMQAMGGASCLDARAPGEKAPKKRRNRPSASDDAGIIRDRVSKQCLDLQEAYGLSLRETEVMELIARGNSMASIAERLVISENTVRTHAKHIYTKLAIHKRQELLDMLGQLEG